MAIDTKFQTQPGTKQGLGWALGAGILLIVLGLAAMAFPLFAGIAVAIMFGWVLLFSGVSQAAYGVQACRGTELILNAAVALLYIAAGLMLLFYPLGGLITLTLILGISVLSQGIVQSILAWQVRPAPGWWWFLITGVLAIAVGLLIFSEWPSASGWLIGLYVGISLLLNGTSLVAFYLAARGSTGTA